MKKFASILVAMSILFGFSTVMADSYKNKTYKFDAVGTTAAFTLDGEYKTMGTDNILLFDEPVTVSFEGNADTVAICDITLTKYEDDEILYEVSENFMETYVVYSNGKFKDTVLTEGAHLVVLTCEKDELGSAVVVIVGKPEVAGSESETPSGTVPEGMIISDWAVTEVTEAFDNGLISVELYASGDYKRNITRSEFAHVLAEFLKQKGVSYEKYIEGIGDNPNLKFQDTNGDLLIEFVSNCGIINGISETEFNPAGELTREQAAAMLYRAVDFLGIPVNIEKVASFNDENSFSSWAKDSIYKIAGIKDKKNGYAVMGGVEAGIFSPKTGYTVEQALIATKRLLNALNI